MLGRYEPEFEVKLMLRTDLDFEEKTFIEEKINLYVESYHMMLHAVSYTHLKIKDSRLYYYQKQIIIYTVTIKNIFIKR